MPDWKQLARLDEEEWLRRSLDYFQQFGYYQSLSGASDVERVQQVTVQVEAQWDVVMPVSPASNLQLADMYLLSGDQERIWWRDLEVVYPNADAYVQVLTEWAQISRGTLLFESITETWQTPDGPALVVYQIEGKVYQFVHSDSAGDYLDLTILRDLNRILASSGRQFTLCDQGGMPNFITSMTLDEQDRLIKERQWRFYHLP